MQGSAGVIGPEGPTGPTGVKVHSENNVKNKVLKTVSHDIILALLSQQ